MTRRRTIGAVVATALVAIAIGVGIGVHLAPGEDRDDASRAPASAEVDGSTTSTTPAEPTEPPAEPIPLPAARTGLDTEAVVPATYDPIDRGDGVGAFRTNCTRSHYAYDDPIVFPGQFGASHLHLFFGSSAVDGGTTNPRDSPASTCEGGLANRTAYWVPAMVDDGQIVDAAPIRDAIQVYYKTTHYDGVDAAEVDPFPAGLKMISGDPRSDELDTERIWWSCQPTPEIVNHDKRASIPLDCRAGNLVQLSIEFPQCWNGRDLDSPDHRSHLTYGRGWPDGGCPPSHPVALPAITEHVRWTSTGDLSGWRLSSDAPGSELGGTSAHADWWNGWDPAVLDRVVNNCLRPGLDCRMNLLGDGEMLTNERR